MYIGTILRLQIEGARRRLSCELIGVEDGKYLIVKMPSLHIMESVSNLLVNGNEITAKYMHKGKQCSVSSPRLLILSRSHSN